MYQPTESSGIKRRQPWHEQSQQKADLNLIEAKNARRRAWEAEYFKSWDLDNQPYAKLPAREKRKPRRTFHEFMSSLAFQAARSDPTKIDFNSGELPCRDNKLNSRRLDLKKSDAFLQRCSEIAGEEIPLGKHRSDHFRQMTNRLLPVDVLTRTNLNIYRRLRTVEESVHSRHILHNPVRCEESQGVIDSILGVLDNDWYASDMVSDALSRYMMEGSDRPIMLTPHMCDDKPICRCDRPSIGLW